MVDKIKNITVFQFIKLCFCLFIIYAGFDIFYKKNELKKYNVELILKDIQKKYPKSEIGFQNLIVEANVQKKGIDYNYYPFYYYYYNVERYYIKNSKLYKEPNFFWWFILLPVYWGLYFGASNLKMKDISKINIYIKIWAIISLIICFVVIVIPFYFEEDYTGNLQLRKERSYTYLLTGKIELNEYRKTK